MKYIVSSINKVGTVVSSGLVCPVCAQDDFEQYTQLIFNEGPLLSAENIETAVLGHDRKRTFCYKCASCTNVMIFERLLKMRK